MVFTKMKKKYAVIMTAAMLTGIMTATALAEGTDTNGSAAMSGPQMPGSSESSQPPQMNGQQFGEAPSDNGFGQAPEMNGQQSGEAPSGSGFGQAPEMNGQQFGEAPSDNGFGQAPETNGQQSGEAPSDSGFGQAPEMNGQQSGEAPSDDGNGQMDRMHDRGPGDHFGFISFEDCMEDGTISQETYDAITKFMEENKPELPEGMTEGERPELPEGAEEGERPAPPEGGSFERKEGEGPDLLKDLLENGVITQEEYDALAAAREADRPDASAQAQSDDSNAA